VAAHRLPYNLGLVLAILVGIGAGLFAEGYQRRAAPAANVEGGVS
jgi:hypothetical protein